MGLRLAGLVGSFSKLGPRCYRVFKGSNKDSEKAIRNSDGNNNNNKTGNE